MIGHRLAWIVIPAALLVATVALAADPTPAPNPEVQKLQAQIEQMSKELEQMKQEVKNANLTAQQRQMMMGHMGRMEGHMHEMRSNGCMTDSGHMMN